jgi:hypothetical protein
LDSVGNSRFVRTHSLNLQIQLIKIFGLLKRELGAIEVTWTGLDMMSVNNRRTLRQSD